MGGVAACATPLPKSDLLPPLGRGGGSLERGGGWGYWRGSSAQGLTPSPRTRPDQSAFLWNPSWRAPEKVSLPQKCVAQPLIFVGTACGTTFLPAREQTSLHDADPVKKGGQRIIERHTGGCGDPDQI